MHPARAAAMAVPPISTPPQTGMVRSADEMEGGADDGVPPAKRQKVAKLPGGALYPEETWITMHPASFQSVCIVECYIADSLSFISTRSHSGYNFPTIVPSQSGNSMELLLLSQTCPSLSLFPRYVIVCFNIRGARWHRRESGFLMPTSCLPTRIRSRCTIWKMRICWCLVFVMPRRNSYRILRPICCFFVLFCVFTLSSSLHITLFILLKSFLKPAKLSSRL